MGLVRLLLLEHKVSSGRGSNCQYSFFQVDIAQKLVETAWINQQNIAILSPYNAQVSDIKENLKEKNLGQITVTTITKSQGDFSQPLVFRHFYLLAASPLVRRPGGRDGWWGFLLEPHFRSLQACTNTM